MTAQPALAVAPRGGGAWLWVTSAESQPGGELSGLLRKLIEGTQGGATIDARFGGNRAQGAVCNDTVRSVGGMRRGDCIAFVVFAEQSPMLLFFLPRVRRRGDRRALRNEPTHIFGKDLEIAALAVNRCAEISGRRPMARDDELSGEASQSLKIAQKSANAGVDNRNMLHE